MSPNGPLGPWARMPDKGFYRRTCESKLPSSRPRFLSLSRSKTSRDFKMPVNQHILREELMRYLPVEQRACADPVAIPSAPLMGTLELPSEECDPPRARASRRCQIPPRHRFSPSPTARPPSVKPITNPGPLQFLGNLGSGSYGSAVCVRDLSSGATVCLKIVIKPPAQDEARKEQLKAERRAYEAIAKSDTQCKFLMVCHGIFMAGEYVYFAMVSEERLLPAVLPCVTDCASHSRIIFRETCTRSSPKRLSPTR